MKTSELKARIQTIINNEDFDFRQIALRAILRDLDAAELRKCPKCGNEDEPLQACDHCGHTWYTTSKLDRGIERAEPPKPTGEQLKAIGKVLDGDEPKKCKAGNLIWTLYTGASICRLDTELEGKLRWHLKDAPSQPALMICNHAGECGQRLCGHREPHELHPKCSECCEWISDAVCVPWVEPVKHYSCDGCAKCPKGRLWCVEVNECFDYMHVNAIAKPLRRNWTPKEPEPAAPEAIRVSGFGYIPKGVEPVAHTSCEGCAHEGINFFMCGGCFNQMETMSNQVRRNYTPKEPEPAAPDSLCLKCKHTDCWERSNTIITCAGFAPKEPKAEPGLEVTLIGDLSPCPFCGSIELSCNGHSVECDICRAEGPTLQPIPDGNSAKKMWNSRAKKHVPTPQPAPVAESEIDKLDAAVDKFKNAMKGMLFKKHSEGLIGWDKEYPSQHLAEEILRDSASLVPRCTSDCRKLCVDIANRAMMLWHRAEQSGPVKESLFIRKPTNAEINDACMSFTHDFGLLGKDGQDNLKYAAKEWLKAWAKQATGGQNGQ